MILTTKTKIAFASAAHKIIASGRAIAGKRNWTTVSRGGIKWRLDLDEGIDFSIYLLGAFEPSTVATLRRLIRPGAVVFDIGANIGAHTLGMARNVGTHGRVLACEPSDFAFAKLEQNLALNPELRSRTRCYQVFLAAGSDERKSSEIYASWPLDPRESVHPQHRGRLVSTAQASVDTLDHIVDRERLHRLDLIKIDVDGHEYAALKGGMETLRRFHPILLMEMSPYIHAQQGHDFGALILLLVDAGYRFRDAKKWKPLPKEPEKLLEFIPYGASINVIASHPANG